MYLCRYVLHHMSHDALSWLQQVPMSVSNLQAFMKVLCW